MKYAVKIKYAIWHRSYWEVEAPDQAAAEQMIENAFMVGDDFVESADCHRTEEDCQDGGPFEEIEEITEIEKTEVAS